LRQAKHKKPGRGQVARRVTVAAGANAVQAVSHGMSFWFLLLAGGLAVLCSLSLYFGLFVVASTFGSILLVSVTLYAFFKYWPEDDSLKPLAPKLVEPEQPKPRNAVIQVVRV
jgi:hypothetical protein